MPAIDSAASEPQAFDIAMGVRRGDAALRDTLTRTLDRIRPRIDEVLRQYDVTSGNAEHVRASARTP